MKTTQPDEIEGGFSRRWLRGVVGVAVGSFLVALGLIVFGPQFEPRESSGTNSFSYSAVGHRGFVEWLRRAAIPVVVRRQTGTANLPPRGTVLLIEPELEHPGAGERALRALAAAVEAVDGKLVLVLPKWQGEPSRDQAGWVAAVEPVAADRTAALERAFELPAGSLSLRRFEGLSCRGNADVPEPQIFAGDPLAVSPQGCLTQGFDRAFPARAGYPPMLVLADPDVLNNHGLGRGGNASWTLGKLELPPGTSVVIDETFHGFGQPAGPLAVAFRLPLAPLVIQSLLLAALAVWFGIGRFGKPLPAATRLAPGKAVLIESSAALLTSAGHWSESLERYSRQTIEAVAAQFHLRSDVPLPELLRRLDELARARGVGSSITALERRRLQLGTGPDAGRRGLALARLFHQWRQEMTHGQRSPS